MNELLEARDVSDRVEELLADLSHEERIRPRRGEEAVKFLGGMVSKHGLYRLAEANAIPHEKADGIPRAGASRSSSRLYFTFLDLARWRAARYRPESAAGRGPILKTKAPAVQAGARTGGHEHEESTPT